MRTINPTEAMTPARAAHNKLRELPEDFSQPQNIPTNHANPRKETGHPMSGIVPHGPFVMVSQLLPGPQPGSAEMYPSFVPTSEPDATTDAKSAMVPTIISGDFWLVCSINSLSLMCLPITCVVVTQYQENPTHQREPALLGQTNAAVTGEYAHHPPLELDTTDRTN